MKRKIEQDSIYAEADMRKLLCILICTTLLIIFDSGCTPREKPSGIFDYTRYTADFVAVFPSEYGDVECSVTRDEDTIALSVVKPERSSYLAAEIRGGVCAITSPVENLPLSAEAARGLTAVFDLLYRGDNGVRSVKKSSDGLETVITYEDGAVILGEDKLPVSVLSPGMNGEMRTVRIIGYSRVNE